MAAQNTTDQLKAQGFRLTPQRLAILRILEEAGGHVSPAAVYQQASRQMPGITEATVYRTLEFLSQQGCFIR
jgi:Fe2+ or Zn2+ uptake regulation protein